MAVISIWALVFFTQVAGLTATEAGLILAAPRLLDAVASPLIGHISDNFGRTWLGRRFGRRRFFILASIPLLPSFAFVFLPGQDFWYYMVALVLFELVYAMEIIPYETLAAEMSSDFKTKAKFAGARILIAQCSAILAGILPAHIIAYLGKDDPLTFLYMGILFSALFMITAALLFAFSWEREGAAERHLAQQADHAQGKASPIEAFGHLYRNLTSTLRIRAFRIHLGMYLGGYISQDIFNSAFTFFLIFALSASTALSAELIGGMYFVQLLSVGIAILMLIIATPRITYQLALLSFAAGVVVLIAVWTSGAAIGDAASAFHVGAGALLAIALLGLGRGALNYVPWATYNYMADVDEAVTGLRREGSFAGVMTFIRKTAQSFTLAGTGFILDAGGFVSGAAQQSEQALMTIATVMGAGTLAVILLGFLVSTRFNLNGDTHKVLMEAIDRFRDGERTPKDGEMRRVVEDLTGWPYEQLWGNNPVGKRRHAHDTARR